MLNKLPQSEYKSVLHLFAPLDYHLIIQAVIEGTSPGVIYVDDRHSPLTAFLCSSEGFYLTGDSENAAFVKSLNTLIAETLFADNEEIALGIYPQGWEAKLVSIFPRSPFKVYRKYYSFKELKLDWKTQIADGYSIHRIDKQLVEQSGIAISDDLLDWMDKNWGSVEQFLQNGLGCCCLHSNEMVSWSITDCISVDRCEIGIYTVPEHREQGLAALTVAATVEQCLASGLVKIGWHCNADNVGSWKVAEKVGFEQIKEYVQHYCMADEVDHLAEMGFSAFKVGNYQETVHCYDKVFALSDEAPDYFYHLAAQACAAVGDYTKAIEYFTTAIDRGWEDIGYTQSCEEFRSLQDVQEWQQLLARLQR